MQTLAGDVQREKGFSWASMPNDGVVHIVNFIDGVFWAVVQGGEASGEGIGESFGVGVGGDEREAVLHGDIQVVGWDWVFGDDVGGWDEEYVETDLAQYFRGEIDDFDHFGDVLRWCWTERSTGVKWSELQLTKLEVGAIDLENDKTIAIELSEPEDEDSTLSNWCCGIALAKWRWSEQDTSRWLFQTEKSHPSYKIAIFIQN